MRRTSTSALLRIWISAIAVFLGGLVASTLPARAQCTNTAGNNAVYGTCSGSVSTQGSPAYIDASAVTQGTDFCDTLYKIISGGTYPSGGAVIDARGFGTSITCAAGSTPWTNGTAFAGNPATILLPAGTITISNTWILPLYGRIVGQGPGLTTIVPGSGFTSNPAETDNTITAMVEMGSRSTHLDFCGTNTDCVGVGVQDLTLNLNGASIPYGIYNAASQELSYVDNVVFNNVGNSSTDTYALEVTVVSGPSSSNSGPYSNLICNIGAGATALTRCVDLTAHTRGVQGISCNGGTASPTAAIYLDSDGNAIEDVYVNNFLNGIYVGSQAASTNLLEAPSNVLYNINGGSALTNLIHISSNLASSSIPPACPGGTSRQAVCDLTIMNATAAANTTIQDDLNTPALTVTGGDGNVGVYILGEQIGTTSTTPVQYTRFTTSPRVPTWGSGNTTPSGVCTATTSTGSIYSNVTTGTGGGLYACIGTSWAKIP